MRRGTAAPAVVTALGMSGCAGVDSTVQRVLSGSAIGAGVGAGVGAATGYVVDQVAD